MFCCATLIRHVEKISWQVFNTNPPTNFSRPQITLLLKFAEEVGYSVVVVFIQKVTYSIQPVEELRVTFYSTKGSKNWA